jgi:hypothetical protein
MSDEDFRTIINREVRAGSQANAPYELTTTFIVHALKKEGFAVVKLAEHHTTDPDWRMDFLNELTDYQAWLVSGMFAGRWSDEEFKKILDLAKVTFPSEDDEPDAGAAADRAHDAAVDRELGVM